MLARSQRTRVIEIGADASEGKTTRRTDGCESRGPNRRDKRPGLRSPDWMNSAEVSESSIGTGCSPLLRIEFTSSESICVFLKASSDVEDFGDCNANTSG